MSISYLLFFFPFFFFFWPILWCIYEPWVGSLHSYIIISQKLNMCKIYGPFH
jgi:hypothetical protein